MLVDIQLLCHHINFGGFKICKGDFQKKLSNTSYFSKQNYKTERTGRTKEEERKFTGIRFNDDGDGGAVGEEESRDGISRMANGIDDNAEEAQNHRGCWYIFHLRIES